MSTRFNNYELLKKFLEVIELPETNLRKALQNQNCVCPQYAEQDDEELGGAINGCTSIGHPACVQCGNYCMNNGVTICPQCEDNFVKTSKANPTCCPLCIMKVTPARQCGFYDNTECVTMIPVQVKLWVLLLELIMKLIALEDAGISNAKEIIAGLIIHMDKKCINPCLIKFFFERQTQNDKINCNQAIIASINDMKGISTMGTGMSFCSYSGDCDLSKLKFELDALTENELERLLNEFSNEAMKILKEC